MPTDPYVIDARRRSDGRLVAVKPVKKRSDELQISLYLSSLQDPSNHCVRVLDTFDDPLDQSKTLMVMEYLRPFNDPEFVMIGDVIDFVSQMLEGLAFLHNHRIAHRDIAPPNVMMDGSSLFPNGHHPVYRTCSLDLIEDLTPLLRIDHPVKYFYVDFGLSVRFKPGASSLVVGDVGRDEEVPELSSTVPYDAFKADIYALGNLFDKEFLQKYHGLEFLRDLIDVMKRQQPEQRPPVAELVQMFDKVRKTRNPSSLRWRLAPKSEPAYERLFNDTVAVAKNGLNVLDAVRESDGLRVAMKAVKKEGQEIQISQFLSSLQHRTNHCVPIVDAFRDPLDPFRTIMVMEYLRPWDDPELATVGDAVDFVTQMLEKGLAFLHNQRVAHRDIAPQNVMMDGRALYPQGHHPVWRNRSPDAIEDLVPLARMDHPVKYYYIDFGLSVRFSPGQSSLVVGDVGRDAEVPELSSTVPYDAFKADIYALGNLFDKELAQKYHRLEFLQRIVNSMKQRQPASRPTASQLVTMFQETRKTLDAAEFRWRLAPKSEPVYERLINDTVAVAKNSISQLRRFVRPE
ncbi:hypothetical protein ACG7TL_008567 [Trametes sanguinea]